MGPDRLKVIRADGLQMNGNARLAFGKLKARNGNRLVRSSTRAAQQHAHGVGCALNSRQARRALREVGQEFHSLWSADVHDYKVSARIEAGGQVTDRRETAEEKQ